MKKNIIGISTLVVAVAALVMSIVNYSAHPKSAYVDLGKVYNEFALKQNLEAQLTDVTTLRQAQLDSLKLELTMLGRNYQNETDDNLKKTLETEYMAKRQEYVMKESSFAEETERLTSEYDEQIWKQINQYVRDYGSKHGYNYIYGAEGSGSLMYGSESEDITEEVVAYVNTSFKGS
jgi:outer membrane protein